MGKNKPKVTILGGSTPYTLVLLEGMKNSKHFPPCRIVFHGRSRDCLEIISKYAGYHLLPLGWSVDWTECFEEAVSDADYILHQVRYGGLELREKAEKLAQRLGVNADETLGISALFTSIQTLPDIVAFAKKLKELSCKACIINLTNPLSLTTHIISSYVKNVVGLCELPYHTVKKMCNYLDIPIERVNWSYSGLNHRGFVTKLELGGIDYLSKFINKICQDEYFEGIPGSVIKELGAVPTKYFKFFLENTPFSESRAPYLSNLRIRAFEELKKTPFSLPKCLGERYTAWYPEAVIPFMEGLLSCAPCCPLAVNLPINGLVQEVKGLAVNGQIFVADPNEPVDNTKLEIYLSSFKKQELAVMDAALDPSYVNIRKAVALDESIPKASLDFCAEELTQALRKFNHEAINCG